MANLAERSLTINIKGDFMSFNFQGPWSGVDITRVATHIGRQYRLYIRSVRRGEVSASEAKKPLAKGGKK